MTLQKVVLTLQYCLETFQDSCQCGECDPCTQGQDDIKEAIRAVEEAQLTHKRLLETFTALENSADNCGCTGDLTVVEHSKLNDMAEFIGTDPVLCEVSA